MDTDAQGGAHGEHPPTSIREYVLIGAMLTAVTAVELWASYSPDLLGQTLIPLLLALSAFKFVTVVAMFMHLRYEQPLLSRLFLIGLVLAAGLMLALISIFWADLTDAVGAANHLG